MEIPSNIRSLRNEYANDILSFQKILSHYFWDSNITSLTGVCTELKNDRVKQCPYEDITSPSNWGYEIYDLYFKLDKFPEKRHPKIIKDLILSVDIHIVGDCNNINTLNDPFKWLVFDIKISGKNENNDTDLLTCYHLDRHIVKEEDEQPLEPHPFYHFQFGGKNLLKVEGEINSGSLIVFESPRIAHHPMDVILGIDFIISHFFPDIRKIVINNKKEYGALIEKYQNRILKPYYQTISSNWIYYSEQINQTNTWSPISLCPQVI